MESIDIQQVLTNGKQFFFYGKYQGAFLTYKENGRNKMSSYGWGDIDYYLNRLHWHYLSSFKEIKDLRGILYENGFITTYEKLIRLKEKYEKITVNS